MLFRPNATKAYQECQKLRQKIADADAAREQLQADLARLQDDDARQRADAILGGKAATLGDSPAISKIMAEIRNSDAVRAELRRRLSAAIATERKARLAATQDAAKDLAGKRIPATEREIETMRAKLATAESDLAIMRGELAGLERDAEDLTADPGPILFLQGSPAQIREQASAPTCNVDEMALDAILRPLETGFEVEMHDGGNADKVSRRVVVRLAEGVVFFRRDTGEVVSTEILKTEPLSQGYAPSSLGATVRAYEFDLGKTLERLALIHRAA